MKKPTPIEFSKTFIALMLPAVLAFIIFLIFVGCSTIETMYVASSPNNYTVYNNKKGDLIEVPWDKEECKGYKKPYHITEYNVGTNNKRRAH
jgi:hypothetical protein